MSEPYTPPLDRLRTLGQVHGNQEWTNYSALGIAAEHVPKLLRMVQDRTFDTLDPENRAVWAPVHAWRALGQLRAEQVIDVLLDRFAEITDENWDDTLAADFPRIAALIGPATLPRLTEFLADPIQHSSTRGVMADAIKEIAMAHPERRDECVAIFVRQLERAGENDPSLNGMLVTYLIDLKAVGTAPLIESVFSRTLVDETLTGDWDWVKYDLGLGPKPAERPRYPELQPLLEVLTLHPGNPVQRAKARSKARRKQTKTARKRNRRK